LLENIFYLLKIFKLEDNKGGISNNKVDVDDRETSRLQRSLDTRLDNKEGGYGYTDYKKDRISGTLRFI